MAPMSDICILGCVTAKRVEQSYLNFNQADECKARDMITTNKPNAKVTLKGSRDREDGSRRADDPDSIFSDGRF
ncbi:hypothetical protein PPL_08288 [Heterostelium album PN500]|uniref:Uncharacterized protein n=1 Tax=Heterostelium pallidum (strain ATCC 26659 / Pp 5 / PN500) TaxID=670386 RepID=D3BHS4_HETP5|nr:hypothetical protein PPL_08288 [Heterostelium album PN500]EFA78824.1 hypothetical protein PPL_08288 [Heterostelium album PN500]|eukprot:XP_020430948.1 hypothetical protein PPL_08288 [Heterostelium album PN500]